MIVTNVNNFLPSNNNKNPLVMFFTLLDGSNNVKKHI